MSRHNLETVVWTPNQFMAVKHVCAIRIQTLINHIGAYHLYFSYLKMALQSMRIKKKTCLKLQLIGNGSSSTLPTKLCRL